MARLAVEALLLLLIGSGTTAQTPEDRTAAPCLYVDGGAEGAVALRDAGIGTVCVPPEHVDGWREQGFDVTPMPPSDLEARQALDIPGVLRGQRVASATRTPYVVSNGWRMRRAPDARFLYTLPAERAALAAVEAATWGADAVLRLEAPGDLQALGRVHRFLRDLPGRDLPHMADFAMVDDGSEEAGEVMNLLTRRNLLYAIVTEASDRFDLTVRLGTPAFPRMSTTDPSAFALRLRRRIGDERRSLRIYGSEVVIARAGADGPRARVHLVNYTGREIFGLRVRLRGAWEPDAACVLGVGTSPVEDVARANGFTEFSIPRMELFAVVDLRAGGPD